VHCSAYVDSPDSEHTTHLERAAMTNDVEQNNSADSFSHPLSSKSIDNDSLKERVETISKSNGQVLMDAAALNPETPTSTRNELLKETNSCVPSCLKKRGDETLPVFKKPKALIGQNLIFRNATINDAAFIIEIRTDMKKSAHISKTSKDIKQQEAWLEKYSKDREQIYFVILNREQERVGTVRLYDKKNDSFSWGSWILKDGVASSYAIESALLVYHFALSLGFERAHFDVRKGNESVWKFHERFGAVKTFETNELFLYSISLEAIKKSLKKYRRFLPSGFLIEN
jgi:RimJ/RimL family protein N-acetyltransferase